MGSAYLLELELIGLGNDGLKTGSERQADSGIWLVHQVVVGGVRGIGYWRKKIQVRLDVWETSKWRFKVDG